MAKLKNFQGSSSLRELSRDLFSSGGKQNLEIFEVFRAYIREFSIVFRNISFNSKISSSSCSINQKSDCKCSSYPVNEAQILDFGDFWHFSSCAVGHKSLT